MSKRRHDMPSKQVVAVHEAGHAVASIAAMRAGVPQWTFDEVKLTRDGGGECFSTFFDPDLDESDRAVYRQFARLTREWRAITAHAGTAAEVVVLGKMYGGISIWPDMHEAYHHSQKLDPDGDPDQISFKFRRRAFKIIRANVSAVERIAEALIRRRKLDRRHVWDIVGRAA